LRRNVSQGKPSPWWLCGKILCLIDRGDSILGILNFDYIKIHIFIFLNLFCSLSFSRTFLRPHGSKENESQIHNRCSPAKQFSITIVWCEHRTIWNWMQRWYRTSQKLPPLSLQITALTKRSWVVLSFLRPLLSVNPISLIDNKAASTSGTSRFVIYLLFIVSDIVIRKRLVPQVLVTLLSNFCELWHQLLSTSILLV
jgi:hypothetical protein